MKTISKTVHTSRSFTDKSAVDAKRLLSQSELDRGFICVPFSFETDNALETLPRPEEG